MVRWNNKQESNLVYVSWASERRATQDHFTEDEKYIYYEKL